MCLVAFEECPYCNGEGVIIAPAGRGADEWVTSCSNCDNGVVMVVLEHCSAPPALEVP
jgi:ribosomal protein S27AE